MKDAGNRSIYSSKAYLNQHLPRPSSSFSSHRLSKTKTNTCNMAGFLDEVRHDLSLAETEKRHLQHSIQSLSSQVDTLIDEVNSNERELSCMIDMFRQRRIKFEQKIDYCRRQEREQNEELSRTEYKIF